MRRLWIWFGLFTGLIALITGVFWWIDDHRVRSDLDQARKALVLGQPEEARRQLVSLAARRPGHSEVAFELGLCEMKMGRFDSALDVWAGLPRSSPSAGPASFYSSRLWARRGRLALAEDLLVASLAIPGPQISEARDDLVRMLRLQGRSPKLALVSWRVSASGPTPCEP